MRCERCGVVNSKAGDADTEGQIQAWSDDVDLPPSEAKRARSHSRGPNAPKRVRFLAKFDDALVSHAERSRIVAREHLSRVMTRNGLVLGSVLVDGYVQGTWKIVQRSATAILSIDLFTPVSKGNHAALLEEGGRFLQFATSCEYVDVQFT